MTAGKTIENCKLKIENWATFSCGYSICNLHFSICNRKTCSQYATAPQPKTVPSTFGNAQTLPAMPKDFHQIVWDESLDRDWAAHNPSGHRGGLWRRRRLDHQRPGGPGGHGAGQRDRATAGRYRRPARRRTDAGGRRAAAAMVAAHARDGRRVAKGECVGTIHGPARGLLGAERILLNLLGRLSGIATLTRQYVDAVAGTKARIYDTRKTTPGWRRLEKYAVRCGGGRNHRGGLDEAVLIKDNHLALGRSRPAARRVLARPRPSRGHGRLRPATCRRSRYARRGRSRYARSA